MSDVSNSLFYKSLTVCGMDTWFDDQSKHGREGSTAGSLLGEVSHLSLKQCRFWTSCGRLVHGLFAGCSGQKPGLNCRSEVTNFHTKQAKVLAEGSADPRQAASTILLNLHVHSTGYLLLLFAESTLPLQEAKSIVRSFCQTFLLPPPGTQFFCGSCRQSNPMLTIAHCRACA